MKKLLILALALILAVFSCLFVSCGDETESSSTESEQESQSQSEIESPVESENESSIETKNESVSESESKIESENPNNESSKQEESSSKDYTNDLPNSSSTIFTLSTNIEGCTIKNNTISFSVEKDTESYSFINAFSIPQNFKWELHWEKACLSEYNIVSKTVNLEDGENTLYALFINKNNPDDIYLYEIVVFKKIHYDITPAAAVELAEELESDYDFFSPYMLYEAFYNLGYSEESYTYAYENSNINWKKHAKNLASEYLIYEESFGSTATWYSSDEIESCLSEEGFSYSIRKEVLSDIDWDFQIKKYTQHLSDFYNEFNRLQAKNILDEIVANESGIDYVLENSEIDWSEHALNIAKNRIEETKNHYFPITDEEIKEELINLYEFTELEANYAIENCR